MAIGRYTNCCQFLGMSWLAARGPRGLIRVRTGWSPARARGHGPLGGQFKLGGRSAAIYSEDLVSLVSCFASRHFSGLTWIHAVDHEPWLQPSMNPSPAEQWSRDYCIHVCGSLPDQPFLVKLLHKPAELGRQGLNPVERPDGPRFPLWFDSLETPTGQLLNSLMGV